MSDQRYLLGFVENIEGETVACVVTGRSYERLEDGSVEVTANFEGEDVKTKFYPATSYSFVAQRVK